MQESESTSQTHESLNGLLIAIEGIDGAGKSTLIQHVATQLKNTFSSVVITKEPGGSHLGKKLRALLQHRDTPICPTAEYLLFAADRAQHFNELIIPELKKNSIIISDRMADSSVVYQGYGRGLDISIIQTINNWAMCWRQPDIIIYLKLSGVQARERIKNRNKTLTAFEQEDSNFTQKLITGFDTLYAHDNKVLTLDATGHPEELAQAAYNFILSRYTP